MTKPIENPIPRLTPANSAPAGAAALAPIGEGRLNAMTRTVLQDLARLSADRATSEAAVSRTFETMLRATDAELTESLTATLAELENTLNTIRLDSDNRGSTVKVAGDEAIAQAKRKFEAAKNALRERGETDVQNAKKAMTESVWMAETIHDTSIDKPGAALAKLRAEVERRQRETDTLAARVELELAVLLGPGRAAPRPWASGVTPDLVEPGSARELAERFNAAAQDVITSAGVLMAQRLPKAFVSPLPVIYGIVAGTIAGVGIASVRAMQFDALAAIGGGVALIGVSIVGELIRRRQRQRLLAQGGAFTRRVLTTRAVGEGLLKRADEDRRQQESEIRDLRDREVSQARAKNESVATLANAAYTQKRAEMEMSLREELVSLGERRTESIRQTETERRARLAQADERFRSVNASAKAKHEATRAAADASHATGFQALSGAWHEGIQRVQRTRRELSTSTATTDWSAIADAEAWPEAQRAPACVPLGELDITLTRIPDAVPTDHRLATELPLAFHLPVSLELPDRCSLLLQVGGAGAAINDARAAGLSVLRAATLRTILSFPPAKARITVIDPVGLGQNFAGFMHLADSDAQLITDRIWTEPRHIEARLTDLTEHMETVIQKYLRNEFASIEEYNARAGEVAEPYRFLVIADFPSGFNENSARRLASIISSGPKCGVYTFVMHDTRQQLPQGIASPDLRKLSLRLAWRRPSPEQPGRFVIDDPELSTWPLRLYEPPSDERFNDLVRLVGRRSKAAGRVQVPFAMISPSPGQEWTRSTSDDVSIELGRAGATRLQSMTLGRGTAQHMLLAGRTGSGKSTLLHVMITNLALRHSPDEIELYLVDFKKGVEFKCYAQASLPHARVIAIESEREFGLSVLRRLDAELKRRGELLRDASVQDIRAYRLVANAQIMPRVLLIVDEFQELFVEDDKLAQEAGLLLDRLVRQGRAFGMHVILGSQTLGGAYSLARATMGQMGVRIALQCSEADSYIILSEDNAAARLLSRPGEAIYNDASGAIEGNSLFQISWLSDIERDQALDRINALVTPELKKRLVPPIVFEGNVPARAERNQSLNNLLDGRTPITALGGQPGRVFAWLGDPVAIKDAVAASLRRQSASNILIVGQQEESALAMLSVATIGIAAQHIAAAKGASNLKPGAELARFILLDGSAADMRTAGYLDLVATALPASTPARVVPYRDVSNAVSEIASELQRRQAGEIADAPAIYLVIHGLQRFRSLRRVEDEFDFSASTDSAAPKPDKQLAAIIKDGPSFGVHTLCWVDTVTTLQRTLERNASREFDVRVLFQMSAADASVLVDAPGASVGLIGQNRAIIHSEEQGTVEKFRPYAVPDESWLRLMSQRLLSLGR